MQLMTGFKRPLLLLALPALLIGARPLRAEQPASTNYRLFGETVSYGAEERAEAQGKVQLEYRELQIFADRMVWEAETKEVTATGNVRIVSRDRRLTGESLHYNLDSQTGEMAPVSGQVQYIFLTADSIQFLPGHLVAHNAQFTTCNRSRPDYRISTRRVEVYFRQGESSPTPERIQVRSAGLELHGHRLFTLPPFATSIGGVHAPEAEQSLPLPYPGYDKLDGLSIGYSWGLEPPGSRWNYDLKVRATSKRGTRAAAYTRYALSSRETLRLTLSHREDLRDRPLGPTEIDTGLSKVLVDRAPELALVTNPRRLAGDVRWDTLASWGRYHESPTDVSADRAALVGRLLLGPFPAGPNLSFTGALAYRAASYSNGDQAGTRYSRVTAHLTPSERWDLSLSLINRRFTGSTPFRFDRVDLTRELAGELGLSLGTSWRVRLLERYDLERQRIRDSGVAITYRAHCLDYSLGWRQNRGLLELGVSLAPSEAEKSVTGEGM